MWTPSTPRVKCSASGIHGLPGLSVASGLGCSFVHREYGHCVQGDQLDIQRPIKIGDTIRMRERDR